MKLPHGLFLCAALVLSGSARADFKPENITAGEIALLPSYCIDTESMSENDPRSSPRAKQWKQQMGETFMALHHYCWGLVYVSRARQKAMTPLEKKWHYSRALNDYDYVLQFSKSDFVLLPEILLRVGEAHVELKDYGAAVGAFAKSIEAKRDYWPAYERWASLLERLGKKREAMNKLEDGLRVMPNEVALVTAYEKLGGNARTFVKSLPAAVAQAPTPKAAAANEPAPPPSAPPAWPSGAASAAGPAAPTGSAAAAPSVPAAAKPASAPR